MSLNCGVTATQPMQAREKTHTVLASILLKTPNTAPDGDPREATAASLFFFLKHQYICENVQIHFQSRLHLMDNLACIS